MLRALVACLGAALTLTSLPASAADGDSEPIPIVQGPAVGTETTAADGLDVTLTSLTKTIRTGSIEVSIAYTLKNNVADSKIMEGHFWLAFEDGTSESQYGFFNYMFQTDVRARYYTWRFRTSQQPLYLEYATDRTSATPTPLRWYFSTPPTPTATPSPSETLPPAMLAVLQQHRLARDCWTAVDGKVYNVTNWIMRHPGGSGVIAAMCGVDASLVFKSMHGKSEAAMSLLTEMLVANPMPVAKKTITCTNSKTKKTKKVTALKPKCPVGWKIKR